MATFSDAIISEPENILSIFFLHFLNLDSILNILKQEMSLRADVFLNLRTPKKVLR